jgi:hypothetical protein
VARFPQHSICSKLLLKSLDLNIVLFYGQFVGVIKAVEPPPQQSTQILSYAVVGAGHAGLRAWSPRRGLGMRRRGSYMAEKCLVEAG